MKLLFNLEYRTNFGEELVLNVIGENQQVEQHVMSTQDGYRWTVEMNGKQAVAGKFMDYYYSLMRGDKEIRHEWLVEPHRLEFAAKKGVRYTIYDHWIDTPEDSYMYSSAFTDCVMSRERQLSTGTEFKRTIRLKVRAPQLRNGERLALVGSSLYLGEWDCSKALPMAEHESHEWVVSLDADLLPDVVDYKFIILGNDSVIWENCENRILVKPAMEIGEVVVIEVQQSWFSIPLWKGAGTVIPVFSLRSEGSFGVGDFGDLRMIVDWCAKTGQNVLQILPINDTTITHTWQDSYPYNSISIYALHPQYTDLRQLPALKDETLKAKYETLRQELNALPQIDYERMMEAKMGYLQAIFKQEGATIKRRASYKKFVDDNRQWLEPYARFCFYRDKYGTATFSEWPKSLPKADAKVLDFWYFIQYVLDQQMRAAHEYARKNKVILKGDIPIGISRDGVEAWVEPRYFNLNGQAGAPPDPFSDDGQNWGFPTYNWDEMLKDDCSWWVRRFRKMAEYFDAYRIDHVLGFFRIWEIPVPEKSGLMGQFAPALGMSREEIEAYGVYGHLDDLFLVDHKRADRWHPRISIQFKPAYQQLSDEEKDNFNHLYNDYFYRRNNQYWYNEAMKKLPRLTQATRMLVCAEDLGMVPDCVPWVMNELRILSLEIQSMPKDPSVRFGQLQLNPYRSVCTISTHDMPTLRQWWDEDEARTQDYFNSELHHEGPAPHPMPVSLCKEVVARHLMSPSMLCLLSLQDWLSIDEHLRLPDQNAERINIPANPRHYWRYRMHLTIEQLLKADDFNHEVTLLIKQGNR
ncbi:4-alpha-glucanotransferase [uncultured Prevotella sp.]|uniref:4-alpha-glucanotransferase n=1 Tax=uncultured Prevotella sp. TaxID=159272 RepID=UPI0025FD7F1C|nr:4-alpha-glucanotransferase [uncultured Prevotella sp.]